ASFLQRLVFRNRLQLIGGAVFAILLPLILRFDMRNLSFDHPAISNAALGSLLAMTIGFLCFRRIINFPGTNGTAYSVPIFALTYGGILILFLFLRLDYSRYLFGIS